MRLLCLGAEASGNRVMGRILATAGVHTVEGPMDEWMHYIGDDLVMTARSLPHGEKWPDVARLIDEFKPDKILVMWRDRQVQARSSLAGQHVSTLEEAYEERERADQLVASLRGDVRVVVYELLVRDPEAQIANLSEWLGVTLSLPEPIYDADSKWTTRTPPSELTSKQRGLDEVGIGYPNG